MFRNLKVPSKFSLVQVIRKKYGSHIVDASRKVEKLDFKYWKVKLDLDFLLACRGDD